MAMRNENALFLGACGGVAFFVMVAALALVGLFIVQTQTHGAASDLLARAKAYVVGQAHASAEGPSFDSRH